MCNNDILEVINIVMMCWRLLTWNDTFFLYVPRGKDVKSCLYCRRGNDNLKSVLVSLLEACMLAICFILTSTHGVVASNFLRH